MKLRRLTSTRYFWLFSAIFILIVYYAIFHPLFNLGLVGDDYITIAIYQGHLDLHGRSYATFINYLFSDWGVQDTIAYAIYKIWGFQPQIRYILSFVARYLAALSFLPLVYYLTKNKIASVLSALFFAITVIAIQTSQWSISGPNFFAIISLIFFLLSYFRLVKKHSLKEFLLSGFLYLLTIFLLPIRMIFLPGFILLCEIYIAISKNIYLSALKRIIYFFILFFVLVNFTHIGNSIFADNTGHWVESSGTIFDLSKLKYLTSYVDVVKSGSPVIVTTPIRQLGMLLRPDKARDWSPPVAKNTGVEGVIFLLLLLTFIIISKKSQRKYVVSSILLLLTSLIIFWVGNPNSVNYISDRYLIIPAVSISILFGLIIARFKGGFVYLVALTTIIIQSFYSYTYLVHMTKVRSLAVSERIRNTVPCIPGLDKNPGPVLYYFSPDDSDTISYTLTWGFNYIMGYKCGLKNLWNFASTNYWDDVESAYRDGNFFTLFDMPQKTANLENIYSYKMENDGSLIDTTSQTRQRLINEFGGQSK